MPIEIDKQEDIDEALSAMTRAFKNRSLATASAWRQLPLVATVANGRSGWLGSWSETSSTGLHPFSSRGGAGLRTRCLDGMPMGWGRKNEPAQDHYILMTAAESGYDLDSWDGNAVLEGVLAHARAQIGSYYKPVETHTQWKATIAEYRIGLVAGWEQETGPLHAVSEVLVGMAGNWEGSVGSLLRTSIDVVGAAGSPELADLAVFQADLEY